MGGCASGGRPCLGREAVLGKEVVFEQGECFAAGRPSLKGDAMLSWRYWVLLLMLCFN